MCTFYYHYRYDVCGCIRTAPGVPREDRKVYVICSQGRFYPADRCPNYTSGPDDASVTAVCAGMCPDCREEAAAWAFELASTPTVNVNALVSRPLTQGALAAVNRQPPMSVDDKVEAWLDRITLPPVPSYMQEELRAIATRVTAGTAGAPMTTPPAATPAPLTLPELFPNLFKDEKK